METLQPILKRGREVWNRINMPEEEFRGRIEKLRKSMINEGIEVLFLYGYGLNDYGNACYVSNYATKMPQGALVAVPKEGEATLIFQGGSRELKAAETVTWMKDIRSSGDMAQGCLRYLQEKNLLPSKIGFIGLRQLMSYKDYQSLVDGTKACDVVEADHLLTDMRSIKSQRECDQIRRSARIVNHAFHFIASSKFPDINEWILDARIDREVRMEGVEDVRILIGKPEETNWAFRPPEDQAVSDGDSIMIYLAVAFERYWAEGIRTFTYKDASFSEKDHPVTKELYSSVLSEMKPGKTMSQLYKGAIQKIESNGLAYLSDYGMGGGIGLGLQEDPKIWEKDKTRVKKGMTHTFRLPIKDAETSFVIGNTIYMSKNGPEVLTE